MEMLVTKLKQLMVEKSAVNGRKITYEEISKETGIGISTLSRIANEHKIRTEHIEKLCNYFNCKVEDFMTIIPDTQVRTEAVQEGG